jgi:hypothetical protein
MKILLDLVHRPGLLLCTCIALLFMNTAQAASPAPATEQSGPELRSLSGLGENYEVILKYAPFTPGKDVSLTAYILDKATNAPVQGASLSGSMSSGSESIPCTFTETSPSLAGAYQGTIRVVGDEPYSWLFEVSHGDKDDLIALDGFRTVGDGKGLSATVPLEPKETGNGLSFTVAEIVAVIAAFVVLQVAIFFFLRSRFSLTAAAKDPR